jgi:hypothetical protein
MSTNVPLVGFRKISNPRSPISTFHYPFKIFPINSVAFGTACGRGCPHFDPIYRENFKRIVKGADW